MAGQTRQAHQVVQSRLQELSEFLAKAPEISAAELDGIADAADEDDRAALDEALNSNADAQPASARGSVTPTREQPVGQPIGPSTATTGPMAVRRTNPARPPQA